MSVTPDDSEGLFVDNDNGRILTEKELDAEILRNSTMVDLTFYHTEVLKLMQNMLSYTHRSVAEHDLPELDRILDRYNELAKDLARRTLDQLPVRARDELTARRKRTRLPKQEHA